MRRRSATEGTFDLLATELFAVACIAVALAISAPAQASSGEDEFEAGMEAYQSCQYADALTSLTLAAHLGHRRAQEIAGLMNLLGAPLYGSAVGTDRSAALRWFGRAAMQGSEIGAKLAGLDVTERFVETAPGETVDGGDVMAQSR